MASKLDSAFETWNLDKSDANLGSLLTHAEPVISAGMRTYGGIGKKDDPVLRLEAMRLVTTALPRYNPKKAKLGTYLMFNLRALARMTHRRAQDLKIPQKAWFDLQNMQAVRDKFAIKGNNEPSMLEMADATGLASRRIQYLEKFRRSSVPESVLREKAPEQFFEPGQEVDSGFWGEAVYYSLSPKDQLIFDWRLGRHGKSILPNTEIARKLGVTPPAVSQRVSYILKQLDSGRA